MWLTMRHIRGAFQFSTTGGQQEGHPACKKTEWWGAGVVICLERDLHMAQLMPLPLTVSCFSKIRIGFTFRVVPDKGPLNVCVCGGCCYRLVGLWRDNWPHEGLWTASNTGRLSVVNNELMAGLCHY